MEHLVSNAEVALLGLLAEGPSHAWRLQKEVEFRDMRSWTDLSQSAIYRQLRSLEAAGHVTAAEDVADGRLRKVYSITEVGTEVLSAALIELLSEPELPKSRIDIATYNIDRAPRGEALEALARYRERIVETIEGWKSLEEFLGSMDCPRHRFAVARRTVRMLEGELVWLDEFRTELEVGER